ncbi:MAG: phosphoadenosine phosphosulfate reductase family protein, partial [Opitutales bacterium]
WGQFASSAPEGGHVRVQPLLEWTELDIWEYIRRENIPNPTLYFSRNGKRFRSLGCHPITHPVDSPASNIDEIIEELKLTKTSERAGRAQDHVGRNSMQELRAKGFM